MRLPTTISPEPSMIALFGYSFASIAAAIKFPIIFAMVIAFDINVADANDSSLKYSMICGVRLLPAIQLTAKNA